MELNPLPLFIPARKLLEHELAAKPDLFGANMSKKGTHPLAVLLNWHCEPEGVRITVDPWLWNVKTRNSIIRVVEWARIEDRYEEERRAAGEAAAEEARRQAWKDFPSFKRWKLLNDLEATPR